MVLYDGIRYGIILYVKGDKELSKYINLLKTLYLKHRANKKLDYNSWIFSSVDNNYFNYNSKYLFEYILEHEKQIKPYFVINDDAERERLNKQYGAEYFIETKTNEGILKVLNAGVWFTSAGLPVYGTNLKKDRLIINLWHGVPLKKIALMENHVSFLSRLYFKYLFSHNYTHVLTTSTKLIEIMKKSFAIEEQIIKVWGQPRNDVIFKKQDRDQYLERILGKLPQYDTVMLYAPTYREESETQLFPFEGFSQHTFEQYLEENKILCLIRTHISERGLNRVQPSSYIRIVNADIVEDATEILNLVDLLITDYSSIYIDYLLTERPVLFLPYDKEAYFQNRGFNFEYDEVTPGPKPDTYDEFCKEITRLLTDKQYYLKERKECNDLFNEIKSPCSEHICTCVKQSIEKGRNKR